MSVSPLPKLLRTGVVLSKMGMMILSRLWRECGEGRLGSVTSGRSPLRWAGSGSADPREVCSEPELREEWLLSTLSLPRAGCPTPTHAESLGRLRNQLLYTLEFTLGSLTFL